MTLRWRAGPYKALPATEAAHFSRRRLRILGTVDVEPTSEVIARSADLMVLVDKYPIATADARTWLSLTLLVLWAMLVLLCGLLAEASARGL
jgi:hypothetical protein